MSADDTRRMNIFEGKRGAHQGEHPGARRPHRRAPGCRRLSILDRHRQPCALPPAQDPKEGKEGAWVDGEALRIEIDDRNSKIELFENARVNRDGDEVAGSYILVDQRSDFFSVSAGKGSSGGRVRAVIQPKINPADAEKKNEGQ